jgi:hypothetical protein
MQQHAFENVAVASQMHPSHPSGFVEMRERPFQALASLPQQPFASWRANAPAIAIDSIARLGAVLPVASSAIVDRHGRRGGEGHRANSKSQMYHGAAVAPFVDRPPLT